MTTLTSIPRLLIATLLGAFIALLSLTQGQELNVRMSSQFLVQGERASLEYVIADSVNPRAQLKLPQVEGLDIRSVGVGAEPRITFGRRREFVYRFAVTSWTPGIYNIPSARLVDESSELVAPPVTVKVLAETDLTRATATVGG
ncbi:MAG: hypothetical protein ACQKBU_03315, partial [Verrucomicrobiales bacterium]